MFFAIRRGLACVAIALTCLASLPIGAARAGLVSTDAVIADTFGVGAERARVAAFLARDDVKEQLVAMGVEPSEAALRVGALSDEEISRIAGELDNLPAGEGVLTSIAIVAGVLLIVLLITDLAGFTNVFTFVR